MHQAPRHQASSIKHPGVSCTRNSYERTYLYWCARGMIHRDTTDKKHQSYPRSTSTAQVRFVSCISLFCFVPSSTFPYYEDEYDTHALSLSCMIVLLYEYVPQYVCQAMHCICLVVSVHRAGESSMIKGEEFGTDAGCAECAGCWVDVDADMWKGRFYVKNTHKTQGMRRSRMCEYHRAFDLGLGTDAFRINQPGTPTKLGVNST